jgi:integrase
MSKSTAHEYRKRLTNFREFIANEYATPTDDIVTKIRDGILDVYDVLNGYSAYLQRNHSITTLTLKQRIVTVKNFLEYNDVDISPRKFKLKVKLPRAVRKNKEALSKQDIGDILNA